MTTSSDAPSKPTSRPWRTFFIDGAVGLLAFVLIATFVLTDGGAQAGALSADMATLKVGIADLGQQMLAQLPLAAEQASATSLPASVFRRTDHQTAVLLLALVFAALTALNVGFWRHLQSTYAPVRRGAND